MVYDILLTAVDEATLVWKRKNTLAFPVFLAMRYLPLLRQLFAMIEDFLSPEALWDGLDAQIT